jgi:hypothetical protein
MSSIVASIWSFMILFFPLPFAALFRVSQSGKDEDDPVAAPFTL